MRRSQKKRTAVLWGEVRECKSMRSSYHIMRVVAGKIKCYA